MGASIVEPSDDGGAGRVSAALAGDADAAVLVGMWAERQQHAQSRHAAKCWYRLAAEAGQLQGSWRLGALLLDDLLTMSTAGDFDRLADAERWLRPAAVAGIGAAQHLLAVVLNVRCRLGAYVDADFHVEGFEFSPPDSMSDEAASWQRLASASGSPPVSYDLEQLLPNPEERQSMDAVERELYYDALRNDPPPRMELAERLAARGGAAELAEAAVWLQVELFDQRGDDEGLPDWAWKVLRAAVRQPRLERYPNESACVGESIPELAAWWRNAADSGQLAAQSVLAELHAAGCLSSSSGAETESPWLLAAVRGDPAAQRKVAIHLRAAVKDGGQFATAAIWMRWAADGGDVEAQRLLSREAPEWIDREQYARFRVDEEQRDQDGHLYHHNADQIRMDRAAARWWWRRIAAHNPAAQLTFASSPMVGESEGDYWLAHAAAANLPAAQREQAELLLSSATVEEAPDAVALLRSAARQGDVGAQYRLARLLTNARDDAEAEVWRRRAAFGGHQEAQRELVAAIDVGRLTSSNDDERGYWLRRLAPVDPDAANQLAQLLGAENDPEARRESLHWLARAERAAPTSATNHLALADMFRSYDDEVAKQEREHWLRAASGRGNAMAQTELGEHLHRHGDPASRAEAETWWSLASREDPRGRELLAMRRAERAAHTIPAQRPTVDPLWRAGTFHSVVAPYGRFSVVKILEVDQIGVHVRKFSNTFDAWPATVDESALWISNHSGRVGGSAHLPVSLQSFTAWRPVFITQSTVSEAELAAFIEWKNGEPHYF